METQSRDSKTRERRETIGRENERENNAEELCENERRTEI